MNELMNEIGSEVKKVRRVGWERSGEAGVEWARIERVD